MISTSLFLENFRNIEYQKLDFENGINAFVGENAQGKTNIIEAFWLFSSFKSFRGASDKDFIKIGSQKGMISTEFVKNERKYAEEIKFYSEKKKRFFKTR